MLEIDKVIETLKTLENIDRSIWAIFDVINIRKTVLKTVWHPGGWDFSFVSIWRQFSAFERKFG
jgi:hypothetical protein